jgi:outer membrane immunogenic protein
MLKNVLFSLLILLGSAFLKAEAAYYRYCYDWTGIYLGINGEGYSWGKVTYAFPPGGGGSNGTNLFAPDATGGNFSQHPHGALLGAQLGFNQQWNSFVFGVEGGVSGSWVEKTSVDVFAPTVSSTVTYRTSLEGFATLTPRVGVACDKWLFYGKGGGIAGRFKVKFSSNASVLGFTHTFKQRQDHLGWTVGLGVERGCCNWILGLEYDFYTFSKARYGGQVKPPTPFALAFTVHPQSLHTVVARLSYRL